MDERLSKQIEFITVIDEMKNIFRRNINVSTKERENDAEHSWHLAVMTMLLSEYAEEGVDLNKALKMCLVHDLIEVYAGDTFCWDTKANETKAERESLSAEKLFSILPKEQGDELKKLWIEFDEGTSTTAKYANAMDRLQPFILNMNTEGHTWRMAKTTYSQSIGRFGMIKTTLPKIWEYVETNLELAMKKGWIIDDRK